MMTLTIDIPALDRLCAWLESRDKTGLLEQIEQEIVSKLKEAAGDGTLEKAAKAPAAQTAPVEATPDTKAERSAGAEGASAAKQDAPETRGQANGAARGAALTLDAVQRAAAQMRDDGKLKAVTDMFPEFGIKKLSDLKGDQLQQFGDRLRAMGARI